ncbi:hypothetical protein [Nonomuraea sp. NPDC001831]|uniref:hypothetical protein n=1 Tax=Nonomuraea sp. NPDC001831 TaxID=3364340 RepID=UPI0036913183
MTNPSAESATVVHSREAGDLGPRLIVSYAQPPLCGASFAAETGETYQQALAREDSLFGGLKAVRVFYGGLPDPWPGKLNAGKRPMVISFKAAPTAIVADTHDAAMRAWFAAAPADQGIYWTFYHEPEEQHQERRVHRRGLPSGLEPPRRAGRRGGQPPPAGHAHPDGLDGGPGLGARLARLLPRPPCSTAPTPSTRPRTSRPAWPSPAATSPPATTAPAAAPGSTR